MKALHLALAMSCILASVGDAASGTVILRGPSVLHLDARNQLEPTDLGFGITGMMRLQFHQQGEKRKQMLQLNASGLPADSQLGLTASLDTESNVVLVHSLPSDSAGRIHGSYLSKDPPLTRMPRSKEPLPEMLSPLTRVRAICIENSEMSVLGFAWLVNAWNYQYIVRRNLTPTDSGGTAEVSIRLTANARRVNFTLLAGGLTPETEYSLVLDSVSVASGTADAQGRFRLRGWPATAPTVLEVRSLALVQTGGPTVLSTSLPE